MMKLTEETQRKIFHFLWAEPKPSGSKSGRIVAKSVTYLNRYISEEVTRQPLDMELIQKYEGEDWPSYLRWAEDLVALLRAEAEAGGKKQRNILNHAADQAEHFLRRAVELKSQPYLRDG